MGIKRIVDVNFWTDDKVVEMFSPEDKYFMLYLLTNPHTTQLGIYQINKKIMAFETGYSTEAVTVLIDRFQTKYGMIRFSESTKEVAIKNFLKHSIIKGGQPVEDLLKKEIASVKDKSLLRYIYKSISSDANLNKTVCNITKLLNVNDNVNDNDNDNEESYHDSYHDSSAEHPEEKQEEPKKSFVKPTVDEISEYCKERKNSVDANKFFNFYESKGWYIGKNKMKDWKAAVRTWEKPKQGQAEYKEFWEA